MNSHTNMTLQSNFSLWVEKYRPAYDEYVWKNDTFKNKCDNWISDGVLPNVLLSGPAGTGKTSILLAILAKMEIHPADILMINASRERNIDTVQTTVVSFCQRTPFGNMKYVILDEFCGMTIASQNILKGEIEKYHKTTRFLCTVNHKNKIINPILSRMQVFDITSLDDEAFITRLFNILVSENVEFEPEQLLVYLENCKPDLRKAINLLQQNTINNKLLDYSHEQDSKPDWVFEALALFENGRGSDARKMIVATADPSEYEQVYRMLYDNLHIYSDPDEALRTIRDGLVNHAMIADTEINLSATLLDLVPLIKK